MHFYEDISLDQSYRMLFNDRTAVYILTTKFNIFSDDSGKRAFQPAVLKVFTILNRAYPKVEEYTDNHNYFYGKIEGIRK